MKKIIFMLLLWTTTAAVKALTRVTFAPQWNAQAQFAGYFVAKEKGFFNDEGLDVKIIFPSNSQSSHVLLKEGKCQFITTQLLDAIKIRDWGTNLVNILQTARHNGTLIVGRDGKNPHKMKGAKVGKWNAGFSLVAMIANKKEQLDYHFIRFTNNVSFFLSGAIDATLAMSYNEYNLLKQSNVQLDDNCVYRFADHGYDIPDDGLYTTAAYYNAHKDTSVRFARASRRGWEWCHSHPNEALEIVMDYVNRHKVSTNRVIQKLMLREILRLQKDKTGKTPFKLYKEEVELANRLMVECGFIDRQTHYNDIVR